MRGTEKAREIKRQQDAKKKKRNIVYGVAAVVLIAVIIALWCIIPKANSDDTSDNTADRNITITDHYVDGEQYYADIVIKDYGTITVMLDSDSAPVTVKNFVNLAASGFYDGLTFHRIIEGFMMQGGDPNGNGTGGSDETIYGEFSSNGWDKNNIKHERGVISMARSSNYNSASSQFFIMHKTTASLDGDYAAFGHVTEGMDIVDKICKSANPTDSNGTIAAKEQPVIETITVYTESDIAA